MSLSSVCALVVLTIMCHFQVRVKVVMSLSSRCEWSNYFTYFSQSLASCNVNLRRLEGSLSTQVVLEKRNSMAFKKSIGRST